MGFRENLKTELDYNGMPVKELAALAGVKKRALDNYLRKTSPAIPPADAAVKIARVLGVTVEYLITGEEAPAPQDVISINRKLRRISPRDRKLVEGLVNCMLERK
jgi:transcriptional regulator with XRE-family HTH domain